MDTKELFNLYESYLNIYEAPFEITGPHSYKTGDGRPQDDSRIKNTPTVVGTYKGDDSATRKKARNKADKLNQEYGASVYRVNRTNEPRKRGTTVEDSVESDYDKLINERTNISYAREAITNARNNLKKYPQGYKGDDFNHELKLAKSAFKNQVKQEREKRKANEDVEYVLDYLIDEGFTDSYEDAEAILETMSDEWLVSIIEAKVDSGLPDDVKSLVRNQRRGLKPELKSTNDRRKMTRNGRGLKGNIGDPLTSAKYERYHTNNPNGYPGLSWN